MNPDPLELPVQKLEFTCHAERPVAFWPWDLTSEPFEVRLEQALGTPPHGTVYFRVIDDYDDCPRRDFDLEVTLWGRRAVAARDEIRAAIRKLGEELHEPAAFTCEERMLFPARTLRETAEDLPRGARRTCLTLETPLDIDLEPPFEIGDLVADAARRLARYDLEDREEPADVDPASHAEDAARAARAAVAGLEPGFCSWEWSRVGGGEGIDLGLLGGFEFERPTSKAWPWIQALVLGRVGRGRDFGFGVFSHWVQAGP